MTYRVDGEQIPARAKAMGISRQCAHRWVARYDAEGEAGLADRSPAPHRSPRRTLASVERAVVAARREHRRGRDRIGPELGIRPHCTWQNGKVERFNRTLATEWAHRQVFTSNTDRADALAPWLEEHNTRRRHTALGGLPPISRPSPT